MWCSIAELLGTVTGREVVGGHSYGERRSQVRSVTRGRESRGGGGGPESEGEVRGGRGLRGVAGGTRGGGGSQAGRRWPGRVAARAGRVLILLAEEEGDREGGGGGLGRLLQQAAQVSGPQVSIR